MALNRPCSHGVTCRLPWSTHDWSYEDAYQRDPAVADEPLPFPPGVTLLTRVRYDLLDSLGHGIEKIEYFEQGDERFIDRLLTLISLAPSKYRLTAVETCRVKWNPRPPCARPDARSLAPHRPQEGPNMSHRITEPTLPQGSDIISRFLADGGYRTVEAWMIDSDYLLVDDDWGDPIWVDLDDNPVGDPEGVIEGAIEASGFR